MPPAAWVLFVGTFVNRFGSFVITFLVIYLGRKGFSPAQAGIAVSAYGVGSIGAANVGGYLADRLGRRQTIALSMFSSAATMIALSRAETLPLIIGLTAAAGLTAELYRPASSALLADVVAPEHRLAGFAGYRLAVNLGFAAGPAVAGFLADRSFLYLFIGDAVTSAVFGVVALLALPVGTRTARAEEQRGAALRTILGDRTFLVFIAASFIAATVYAQATATFPLAVRDAGLSNATFGFLISLNGMLVVALELPLTSVTRRFPAPAMIALGFVLTGVGFGLTGFAHSTLALSATVLVWTVGEIVNSPIAAAYVAGISPAHLRGRYSGAWGTTFSLAAIVGPAAGGWLYTRDPGVLWTLCAVLGAIAAAVVLPLRRRNVRPQPPPGTAGPEVAAVETP